MVWIFCVGSKYLSEKKFNFSNAQCFSLSFLLHRLKRHENRLFAMHRRCDVDWRLLLIHFLLNDQQVALLVSFDLTQWLLRLRAKRSSSIYNKKTHTKKRERKISLYCQVISLTVVPLITSTSTIFWQPCPNRFCCRNSIFFFFFQSFLMCCYRINLICFSQIRFVWCFCCCLNPNVSCWYFFFCGRMGMSLLPW